MDRLGAMLFTLIKQNSKPKTELKPKQQTETVN